uniref:PDZ domain-containing protein n=1 Tax=Podarcis muralis TaxID=64176 RepID=A0A670KEG5_PODMU
SFFFAGPRDTAESTMKFEFNPRDGIDNPALSLAEDSGAQVRFCFLKKEDGESFGFWLRQEVGSNGHIVRQVTPGGLAHRRGLQDGDRILEVNGAYVEGLEHFRVRFGWEWWLRFPFEVGFPPTPIEFKYNRMRHKKSKEQ